MMFSIPHKPHQPTPEAIKALNLFLMLHADHEQNCSTSTVRIVGSAETNLFSSVASGVCALWGKLHGGANVAVFEMLSRLAQGKENIDDFVQRVKNKQVRLMGFGHRVYKTFDPRAKIAKELSREVLAQSGKTDELLDIALELEERASNDEYFVSRNLYPNVDFYTGITFHMMGIPISMFTVLFAMGRLPGWIAHYLEWKHDPYQKIGRPRQIYAGPEEREVIPISKRT